MDSQCGECGLERFSADIVEIDVDSIWRCYLQLLRDGSIPIIEGDIELAFISEKLGLFLGASRANHPTFAQFGELSCDTADRACGPGNEDDIAGLYVH